MIGYLQVLTALFKRELPAPMAFAAATIALAAPQLPLKAAVLAAPGALLFTIRAQ
jgi:hypothetical protein